MNIISEKTIITPEKLKENFFLSKNDEINILNNRKIISNIIHRYDKRLLVVCGPCSIHDTKAALDYGDRLSSLVSKYKDKLYIVMRVYFEKPRTSFGWKGLINDPYMDESFDIETGLKIARGLLIELVKMKLPLATETLDINTPQYIGDLFSWAAIGARTTESQIHRELASGLSMPVGFKNSTDGNFTHAINAIKTASMTHHFIGINQSGQVSVFHTNGNPNCHMILRGGKKPNYYPEDIINCEQQMKKVHLLPAIMIDCSHGNSNKDYRLQPVVAKSVLQQIKQKNNSIIGIMLESNINAGNQSSEQPKNKIKYGISVTDACIDWESTDKLLYQFYHEIN